VGLFVAPVKSVLTSAPEGESMSGDLKTLSAGLAIALMGVIFRADSARCGELAGDDSLSLISLVPENSAAVPMSVTAVKLTFTATPRLATDAIETRATKENPAIAFGWEAAGNEKSSAIMNHDEVTVDSAFDGTPPAVPLPTPFWSTMATLGGLALIWVVRRIVRREA
jgi:hypothetical protein